MCDLSIVNGVIVSSVHDEPALQGGVAIRDGRIAVLGGAVSGAAKQVLDAAGRAVCPGIMPKRPNSLIRNDRS